MCRYLMVAVLLLSLSMATPCFADSPSAWLDSCRVALGSAQNDRYYGGFATALLAKLPEYERLKARAFSDRRGLQIDVLLQYHVDVTMTVDRDIALSQDRVYNLLSQHHYDVVAVEGNCADPLTLKAIIEEGLAYRKKETGLVPTVEDSVAIANNLSVLIAGNGTLRYYTAHPQITIFGIEEEAAINLGVAINDLVDAGYATPEQVILQNMTSRLRSELGLAKLILKLRTLKKNRGALVIGEGHENELRQLFGRLGLNGTFYRTREM